MYLVHNFDVEAFKKLAKEFDSKIQTREQAFEQLVKEGIYNRDGTLTPEYGGKTRDK